MYEKQLGEWNPIDSHVLEALEKLGAVAFIHDYNVNDSFGGEGEAIAVLNGGAILSWSLSHCSCDGPFSEIADPEVYPSAEEFFKKRGALETDKVVMELRYWLSRRNAREGDPDFGQDLFAYRDYLEERNRMDEALAIDALIGGN